MVSKVMTLQPLSSFGFISISETTDVATRANYLMKEAREALEKAEAELRYGDEAATLSKDPKNSKFVAMAAWHYEQSFLKARKAEAGFLAAEILPISRRRREYCRLRAGKATEIIKHTKNARRDLSMKNSAVS